MILDVSLNATGIVCNTVDETGLTTKQFNISGCDFTKR